ncbi:hypothetical protein AIGOOFII_1593 [Methylobacterium marchantiae]|nr:hypothetical protein AIGOOFII_1593 [Methylobacterium marchantiae]
MTKRTVGNKGPTVRLPKVSKRDRPRRAEIPAYLMPRVSLAAPSMSFMAAVAAW